MLFLPGCPDSRWAAWLGDRPARAAGVRLVGVNRPGYGATPRRPAGHLAVAALLCELADRMGAERFGVLGMSVGGTYALACAAAHPDRVSGVVTVSAPGEVCAMDPPEHRDGVDAEERTLLAAVRSAGSVDAAAALMRAPFEEHAATVLGDDADDDLARRFLAGLPAADAALLAQVPPAVLATQAREALSCPDGYLQDAVAMLRPWTFDPCAIRCPVRVVHGAEDTAASPRNARWLADHVPGATLEILPGTSHLGALHEHWPALLRALEDPG